MLVKHTKNVTDAVRAANRHNAQSSTGPRSGHGKSHSSRNALRHGIFAKSVALETHEKRVEFRKLFKHNENYYRPEGPLEEFLVADIVLLSWKLGISEGLVMRELSLRQDVPNQLDSIFHGELNLPIDESDLPLDRGWDCERLVVRAVAGKDVSSSSASRGPAVLQNQVMKDFQNSGDHSTQELGHLEVEAVLGNALEKMTRYQSALRRDLYRAVEMLRTVQADRRKRRERRKRHEREK
jgi:hypothetical protein